MERQGPRKNSVDIHSLRGRKYLLDGQDWVRSTAEPPYWLAGPAETPTSTLRAPRSWVGPHMSPTPQRPRLAPSLPHPEGCIFGSARVLRALFQAWLVFRHKSRDSGRKRFMAIESRPRVAVGALLSLLVRKGDCPGTKFGLLPIQRRHRGALDGSSYPRGHASGSSVLSPTLNALWRSCCSRLLMRRRHVSPLR